MNAPHAPAPLERSNATTLREAPSRRGRSVLRRLLVWVIVLAVLGGAAAWLWLWPPAAPAPPSRAGRAGAPVPVVVMPAQRRDVPILLDALGTVQAFNSIAIRPQVDGQLIEIAFQEGQEVKRGDVIARIDPRTYQAALDQALAKKAQDEALLANARLDLQRYADLARTQGISRQQQDTQRAQVAQYEAQVAADQAAIDSARVQLSHTTIRSPIDGRIGLRQVDQGNLLRAGDATPIVSVVQLRPITVVFTLPQQALHQVRQAMARGEVAVRATIPGSDVAPADGRLLTLDNQVDQGTGTIRLKAVFPNDDQRLWPGAFVTVRLQVDTVEQATTVPLVAVQRGPEGAYAFVLRDDASVVQRALELGPLTQNLAVVRNGVNLGDRVVVSGALRLTDGARVTVLDPAGRPGSGDGPPRRPRQAAEAPR
jgi:multidrug efflux system membrane fusion protein